MREYEVIREIPNSCSNNQMRDVFIEEVSCESPMGYVKGLFPDQNAEYSEDKDAKGNTVIWVTVGNLAQKFIFTAI